MDTPTEKGEVEVLRVVIEELAPMTHDQRRRIMSYVSDHYRVLIDKCPATCGPGFRSPGINECFLTRGHDGPHVAHGCEWHDTEDSRD